MHLGTEPLEDAEKTKEICMKKSKFTEEQMVRIRKAVEAGA